jgi:hypothetical protein
MEDKLLRFEDIKLSNWGMKQTFASAFCFFIQQQISKNNLQPIICVQVINYMKFFCSKIYSDLLIELYFCNIITLCLVACITGCIHFFYRAHWTTET